MTRKRDDAAEAANPAETWAHATTAAAEQAAAAPTEGAPSSFALRTGKSAKADTETVTRAKASRLELSLEARQTAANRAAFSDRGLVWYAVGPARSAMSERDSHLQVITKVDLISNTTCRVSVVVK